MTNKTDDKISLDELLNNRFHLITYSPRYGNCLVGVFIAGCIEELAMMTDAMTDSGDYYNHIEDMVCYTSYFPWGEGYTFQDALDRAMARVNSVPRHIWIKYCSSEVFYAPCKYPEIRRNYTSWKSLPTVEELMAISDEDRIIMIWRNI